MKLGNINLKNNLILAPMAGFTDAGFRYLAKKYGAALTVTEMVSVKGLLYGGDKTRELLFKTDAEYPCAVQLFGSDPALFFRAAREECLASFDVIDVNMGCPVPKVVKNGEGSALMRDIPRVKEIIAALRQSVPHKTITAKIRAGFDKVNAVSVARAIEEGGGDAVAVHPRLREQFYSGNAEWRIIGEVKSAVGIPVIGNGDVSSYGDYLRMQEETSCDFVMIGRSAVGNPRIFSDILNKKHKDGFFADMDTVRADIDTHIEILLQKFNPKFVLNEIKKHASSYMKWRIGAAAVRESIMRAQDLETVREIVLSIP